MTSTSTSTPTPTPTQIPTPTATPTNVNSGALTYVEIQKDGVTSIDGPHDARSVTVSPDGNHVYAAGEFDDAVKDQQ